MSTTGTITSIVANDTTFRFDVHVTYSDGTHTAQKVVSVDPGASFDDIERQVAAAGAEYPSLFEQQTAFDVGVDGYQQHVGAVIQVS